MLKPVCAMCACLLMASTAGAATLVTWQLNGTVTGRSDKLAPPEPGVPVAPPLGTPVSATFTFDPSSAIPTPFDGGSAGCNTVDVLSGSATIGGYSTPIAGGQGYTGSQLPISVCGQFQGGGPLTEFELFVPGAPPANSFKLPSGFLFLSYRDLLVRDAFPNSPTPDGAVSFQFLETIGGFTFVFRGTGQLSAVEQSTPVPEPGTMALVGIGLLAVARKRRSTFLRR